MRIKYSIKYEKCTLKIDLNMCVSFAHKLTSAVYILQWLTSTLFPSASQSTGCFTKHGNLHSSMKPQQWEISRTAGQPPRAAWWVPSYVGHCVLAICTGKGDWGYFNANYWGRIFGFLKRINGKI